MNPFVRHIVSRFLYPWVILLSLVLLSWGASAARACNVPVFRFALERWRADPYRVTLLHRGPLSGDQQALLRELEEQQDKVSINYLLRAVDVAQPPGDVPPELAAAHASASLPLLVVQYPEHLRNERPVWSGALTREAIAVLTESPVRKELIRRLAEGQTAVWLLLDSGVADKDQAIFASMEEELRKLEGVLTLPELTDAPSDDLLTERPLKVAFSLLRVPRSDPREQALVEMLLRSEPDLAERQDPLVFPVFGRGRALWPLVGAGITADNVHDSASFLVGPCSCEIKELNPGFDLLLNAPWEELLFPGGVVPAALAAADTAVPTEPVLVPIPSGSHPTSTVAAEHAPDQLESKSKSRSTPPPAASSGRTILLTLLFMFLLTMLVVGMVL